MKKFDDILTALNLISIGGDINNFGDLAKPLRNQLKQISLTRWLTAGRVCTEL